MKLKFGVFDGNIVDIAFRISTVFRIETFDKILKGVEIILKFLSVDLVPVILPDAVSGKQIDRRGADFDRARAITPRSSARILKETEVFGALMMKVPSFFL